jgi:hypothetical protein
MYNPNQSTHPRNREIEPSSARALLSRVTDDDDETRERDATRHVSAPDPALGRSVGLETFKCRVEEG